MTKGNLSISYGKIMLIADGIDKLRLDKESDKKSWMRNGLEQKTF